MKLLKIPEIIKAEMIRLAREGSPVETCGYLAGVNGEIREILPLTNVDHSPEHFSFDPKEQFQAVKTARSKGLELTGVYHSHPASPARLSEEDLRLANDSKLIYIIVSLLDPEPVIKAFRVIAKEISEVTILSGEGAENEQPTIRPGSF